MAEQQAVEALIPATAPYSLAAKCGSEMIATALIIWVGESILANELLAKTKGNRMGWGFVAFGFGLSFGFVITMFNYISAHVNPASVLALLVLDELDGQTFVALSASQFAGAFLGAILVWLSFLPHFKTIPEPPSKSEDDLLLRSRDYMTPDALSIASYNTRGEDVKRRNRPAKVILAGAVKDVGYFLSQSKVHPEDHDELLKVAFGGASGLYEKDSGTGEEDGNGKWETKDSRGALRRRSVQVADVHRRLKDMDLMEFQQMLRVPEVGAGKPGNPTDYPNEVSVDVPPNAVKRSNSVSTRELEQVRGREGEDPKEEVEKPSRGVQRSRPSLVEHTLKFLDHPPEPKTGLEKPEASGKTARALDENMSPTERLLEARRARSDALFKAAIVADQNAKLSIFCTRPAIWSPFFNALCEFMCTVALILLYLLLVERGNQLYEPVRGLWRAMVGIWAGFLIFILILGMGGPTGIAANPARDLGPRIAHFVLPIPGKGPSEFYYGWIPVLANFAGGAAAGGLFKAIQHLNHSNVPGATVVGPV